MAQNYIVTGVVEGENEARFSAILNEEKDFIMFEMNNKEIFGMDYDNFLEFTDLIKKEKASK